MTSSFATTRLTRGVLSTLGLAFVAGAAPAASAADGPAHDGPKDPHACAPDRHPGPPGMPGSMGFQGPMDVLADRPPPYLMGVNLTEEQQDKVFSILHAAAPEFREHMKAARKAHDALRDLGQSVTYDNGKAATLAQAAASAQSQVELLRTRVDHEIYMLLTPEQRARIAEKRRERDAHGEPPAP